MLGDEHVVLRIVEIPVQLVPRLATIQWVELGEHRRQDEVFAHRDLHVGQRIEIVPGRAPNDQLGAGHDAERCRRNLPDRVQMLLAEVEAEPGVDERVVRCRHQHVVVDSTGIDPRPGGCGVQLAKDPGLHGSMPGCLHPDVLAPELAFLLADQVADDLALATRDDAGRPIRGERRLDCHARDRRVLIRWVEQRLGPAVPPMSIGEQGSGAVERIGRERIDRDPRAIGRHGPRRVAWTPAGALTGAQSGHILRVSPPRSARGHVSSWASPSPSWRPFISPYP